MSGEWQRAVDKASGRYYFWNVRTRETRWEIDEELKPEAYRKKEPAKEVVDENDVPEKIEERRVKAAETENRKGLEQMLAIMGWSNARLLPEEVLVTSIKPYAKGNKFSEEPVLNEFFADCQKALDEERTEVEQLAAEAQKKLEDAELAAKNSRKHTEGEESRRDLDDFLTKQTAVQREEEKAAQLAANKARAEQRLREREKRELLGTSSATRSRPRRETKSRFVEHNGFMVLKENQYSMKEGIKTYTGQQTPKAVIKSAPTAYGLFSRDHMRLVRQSTPAKLTFTQLQRSVAARWKELDEAQKAPYFEAAKLERERVKAERAALMEAGEDPGPEVEAPEDGSQENGELISEGQSGEPSISGSPEPAMSPAETPAPSSTSRTVTPEGEEADSISRSGTAGTETPIKSADGMTNGQNGPEEDAEITRADTTTPGTAKKDDNDEEGSDSSDSDDDDEEDEGAKAAALVAAGRSLLVNGKFPRPVLEDIIDCALLAIGPRSGCTEEEIEKWILTSPLGLRLKDRLKFKYEQKSFYKMLKKHTVRGRYQVVKRMYMLSANRLKAISKSESLAKVRRRRRSEKTPGSHAHSGPSAQLRLAHNQEIKKAVVEDAFFRWAYMVRKRAVLEPFISENAISKLDKFAALLKANNLEYLADPKLDENDEAWSAAVDQARKQLNFMETPPPLHGQELPQPPTITGGDLRAYQRRGIAWMIRMYENGCNAVLADEMGLGKTLQTISFLCHLKDVMKVGGPFLVIVPLSVLTNWANEFRKWAPSMRVVKLHSSSRDERDRRKKEVLNNFKDFDVVVTTYEMIISQNMRNVLTSKLWWRCVVIDEGHKIKNDETSLSQAVRSMNCQFRLLLTGTPLQNNLHELWAMLNFLDPVLFDSSAKFDSGFDLSRDIVDRELLSRAHYLIRPFCLRRTKAEVEAKLPPKEEIVVNVPMSEMQKFWYKRLIMADAELLERVEEQVANGGDVEEGAPMAPGDEEDAGGLNSSTANDWKRLQSLMMQLRKCCNHPYLFPGAEPDFDGSTSEDIVEASGKLQMLDMLLRKLQSRGHRVVIFSQFTSMLDILSDFLALRGYKHARLDGSTNRVQRAVDVLQYNQADSSHFAYLMSTRAGGLGINLATADTVILYDSDWNPQVDLQAMDRVHRIGQEKPVHVYRLVCKGTVEERIVQRAKKKLFLDSMVNRGSTAQAEALEGLNKAEMLKMLKFGASAVFGGSGDDEFSTLLSDAELDKMLDRSSSALKARAETADTAVTGNNALDFEMEKTQPVKLRDMYGKDFAEEAAKAAETGEPPAKKSRMSTSSTTAASNSAKKKKEGEESVIDIAKEWNLLRGGATKSGRKVKSRFTQVDGHNVLKANAYSLEEGEQSVFQQELANRRRGPDAATLEEINRSLGRGRQIAGRDYTNEQQCLACWDGGELVLCDQCPVAVHVDCLAPEQAPSAQRKGTPTWRCPHHMCSQCERKSAAAGGLLFRCSECLNAYCEDHLPLEGVRLHEDGRCLRFEDLGFRKPSQGYYILCSKNCQDFYNDREKHGTEEAIRRAVKRTTVG